MLPAEQESTFQAFSQFVSTHLPADQYEATMTASNKQHAAAKEVWALRERREDELVRVAQASLSLTPLTTH